MYKAIGNKIVNDLGGAEFDIAVCNEPEKAIKMFERVKFLNDVKRQYTASARLLCKIEQLQGFNWI